MSFPAAPWARRRDGRKADTTIEKQNNDRAPRRSAAPRPEGSGFGAPLSEEELRQARRAQGAKGTARGGNGGKRRKSRRKSRARGLLVTLLVLLLLFGAAAGGVLAAGVMVRDLDTVYPGVSVGGVDMSNRTLPEAEQVLSDMENAYYKDYALTVKLPQDFSLTITAADAGLELSSRAAAEAAYAYGRDGNLLENLRAYVQGRWMDKKVELPAASSRSIDEENIRAMVHAVAGEVNDALLKSEMRMGKYSVNIVKGAHALYIDEDAICAAVRDAVLQADPTPIVYRVDMKTDNEMDLDELHRELTTTAVSSVYDPALGGGTPSQVGVTFDLDNARKVWEAAGYGETVAIPLIITEPEQTAEELNNMLFRDLLGEKTTSLVGSSNARIANVELACEKIGAVVLQPGEKFDYNECLGERTEANGWFPAAAYADGEVRDEYGGGICQVSSTLFVATLLADLDVNSRTCHYFPVGYLTAGMDATVSWGGPEYRFTNSRDYPVRIKAFVSEDKRTVTVQIWGTNVDGSYVKINYSGAMDVYGDDTIVDSAGNPVATGCRATIWCHVLAPDGTILKGEKGDYHWFLSEYHYHTEDIQARAAG